ncbi:hypothetical protein C0995_003032 [Termitomyces sp. Mi166|nr:hypothetical protein C0995_003032 [Termitomyces sp. Mi166\
MKTESESSTPVPTPAPTYTAPQWATTSQIPIDPALQQQTAHATTTPYQHYQYATHYPQATYNYNAYAAVVAQQAQAATATATATATAATATTVHRPIAPAPPAASTLDTTTDISALNDALGSAGVDLRAEEETLQRTHDQQPTYRSFEDRSRKQPSTPSFDTRILGATMRSIGTQHKITKIPDDTTNYMALALRARLHDLVTAMITASHHRTDTQFDRPASQYDDGSPMWSIVVRSDVAKQLAALERVEREDETRVRRERKERQDMAAAHAAALAAQANGAAGALGAGVGADAFEDGEGGVKKKRKKEGPGVTARNMSEDVRKKMSNAVATQAAGLGGRYAWMNASNAAAATTTTTTTTTTPAKGKAVAVATTAGASASAGASVAMSPSTTTSPVTTTAPVAGTSTTTTTSSWARPYVSTKKSATPTAALEEEDTRTLVTMRDAMFVIEKERGHGGGRGAVRGWS